MKILLALARPLFPADTGGKIRSLNIFQRLARRAEIHCVSLVDRAGEREAVPQMERLFAGYTPVLWNETRSFSPRFYAEFLLSRAGSLPYFLAKYKRPELLQAVAKRLAAVQPDVLLCDFLHMGAALQQVAAPRRVLFQHNVEYVIRRRHWEQESNPLRKWLLDAEWRKARAVEAEVCRACDHVLTVSEEDAQQIRSEFGAPRVSALPTGVDADYFQPLPATPQPGRLVFVGSMDWHPNEDGIFWFAREVFPRIRRQAPQATLAVVGRNPSPRLRELAAAQPGVEITGTVPDVRPFLAAAEAVVVPLRIGGGTRIKIFEAMAMQRPVISTTLGAEGLPVVNEKDILLGDDPEAFAQAVLSLLANPERGAALARAGREKVLRDHSWEQVAARMEEILAGVVRGEREAAGQPVAVAAARSMLAN